MKRPPFITRTITRRNFIRLAALTSASAALTASGCAGASSTSASSTESAASTSESEPASAVTESTASTSSPSTEALATFMLMSDVHINSGSDTEIARFRQALADVASFETRPNVIAVIGDLSDRGYAEEHELFKQVVQESDFSLDEMIIAMGNHDLWVVDDAENEALVAQQREDFVAAYNLPGLYYETQVAGQHVVVLGPDKFCSDWVRFDMTDEQLSWLDGILAADAAAGVHTYVFCHEPINNTVPGSEEGSWGSRNSFIDYEKIDAVVSKYPQAVYLSGHTHVYPGIEASDASRPLYVNDGSCRSSYKPGTNERGSWGMHMTIYRDHLEFHVRDFENHQWLEEPITAYFDR